MSKESDARSKSKRVLLTGATGFVGRHLDAALAETNWEVRHATAAKRPDRVGCTATSKRHLRSS